MSDINQNNPDAWVRRQNILVILAHPDDPEFFCGATLARWAKAGHAITYYLVTCGDKGSSDRDISPDTLCRIRHEEEAAAAKTIGVQAVYFLDLPDGYLVPDIDLRRKMTRIIRQMKPDILVTCDPQNLFPNTTYGMNHSDHRAVGQSVLDAVFPAAGNPLYFPELLKEENLEPHKTGEVWISLTSQPNVTLDVTDTWDIKILALKEHKSQIGDPEKLIERMKARRTEDSTDDAPHYEERFRRIIFN